MIGTLTSLVLLVVGIAASLFVGARSVDPAVVWSVLGTLPGQLLSGDLAAAVAPGSGAGMDEVVVTARVPRTITAVLVGAACLIQDFDQAKVGVQMGAPARYAWSCAFGLMVTVVWMYVEILQLLARFRNN